MAFPDPSIPAPPLTPYELSFNRLAFGGILPGSPYQLTDISGGLDLPPIQSGDVQRPLDDGEYGGIDVSQGRDIAIDLSVSPDATSLDHARQALGGAFVAAGAAEQPLFVQLPSGVFACMARPRKYAFTLDLNMVQAKAGAAALLLHATDPRWYSAPTKTATVGLPSLTAGGGLAFPAPVPWVFGSGGAGGLLDVWNYGTVPMFPQLVFTGPCLNPTATNLSLPGAPSLSFAIALAAGDTLTVDTDWQTVSYQTAGTTLTQPRENVEIDGSVWWALTPANGPLGTGLANQIGFSTADGGYVAGTLTVNSGDAYSVI